MILWDQGIQPAAVGLASFFLPCFKVATIVDSIHTGQRKTRHLSGNCKMRQKLCIFKHILKIYVFWQDLQLKKIDSFTFSYQIKSFKYSMTICTGAPFMPRLPLRLSHMRKVVFMHPLSCPYNEFSLQTEACAVTLKSIYVLICPYMLIQIILL